MKRAHVIAAAGMFGTMRLLPAEAQSGPTIRAATGAVEEFALPYYALQKGFFREAGLSIDLTIIPGDGAITQALSAGAVDVAVTNSG